MNKKAEILKFIRFCVVGVLNTLVDAAVFALLIALTPLGKDIAKTISYSLAVGNSYAWNKLWTFKDRSRVQTVQALKFILVNAASFLVSLLVLNLASSVFKLNIAYPLKLLGLAPSGQGYDKFNLTLINLIIVTPFVTVVNFIGNRLLVFKDASPSKQNPV